MQTIGESFILYPVYTMKLWFEPASSCERVISFVYPIHNRLLFTNNKNYRILRYLSHLKSTAICTFNMAQHQTSKKHSTDLSESD